MKTKAKQLPALASAGLLMLGMLVSTARLMAQNPAEAQLEKMSAELNLTPEQKIQIAPILKEKALRVQAIRENPSLTPAVKAMAVKQVHKQTDSQLKPILTPQQWSKLQVMRQQAKQQKMTH
jgi:hypothetical protein